MKHYNQYYVKFDDDELKQVLEEISNEEVKERIRHTLGESIDPITAFHNTIAYYANNWLHTSRDLEHQTTKGRIPLHSQVNKECQTICVKFTSRTNTIMNYKHGDTKSPEWKVWRGMKRRQNREPYLSKGIKVCDEWLHSYSTFLKDMGRKPNPKYELDRIDNSKGYSRENCRWIDKTTQQRNQDQSKWVSINGERKHIIELSEEYGISYSTLRERYNRGIRDERIVCKGRLPHQKRSWVATDILTGYYIATTELLTHNGIILYQI